MSNLNGTCDFHAYFNTHIISLLYPKVLFQFESNINKLQLS